MTGANVPLLFYNLSRRLQEVGLDKPKQTENIVDYMEKPPQWNAKKENCNCN